MSQAIDAATRALNPTEFATVMNAITLVSEQDTRRAPAGSSAHVGPDDPGYDPDMEAHLGTGQRILRAVHLVARHPGAVAQSLVLLLVVAHRLRRHGYASTVEWLDNRPSRTAPRSACPASSSEEEARERALDLAFIVRLTARIVPDATCLRRALVLRYLLGRCGIASEVVLGVRKAPDGAMAFHAWLTAHGDVVSEPARLIDGFVVLDSGRPPPGVGL